MTYEAPEDPGKLCIPGNKAGRPRLPRYSDHVDPAMRLFLQIRTRMEKSKAVTAPEIKGWLIQIALLQAMGYDVQVKEIDAPTIEGVLASFAPKVPEKKPEEAKPIVSAFPKDL